MKYIIYILLLFFGAQSFAQTNPLSRALKLYQNDSLAEAKIVIDSLLDEGETYSDQVVAFYIKGFIYKDLYKSDPKFENNQLRIDAVDAFNEVLLLDTGSIYVKEARQNIKYLATTYYNDAMLLIDLHDFEEAQRYYKEFESIITTMNDSTLQLSPSREQFYLALGSGFAKEREQVQDTGYFKNAEAAFKKVLEKDSLNMQANYNLGALYYNEAVNKITGLAFDQDLGSFDKFEDNTIELFKKALPYMQTAYKLDPKDENVLEGLAGIYFSLREFDMSNKYQKELSEIKKK